MHPTPVPGVGFVSTQWSDIESARRGRITVLNDVLARYRPPLVRFLRSRGASAEDAEDVVQEVLLALTSRSLLERADPSHGRFRSLLIAITKNLWSKRLRSQKTAKRGGTLHRRHSPDAVYLDAITDKAPTPEFESFWLDHLLELSRGRLRDEDERAHQILSLHVDSKLSYKQIAEELGINRDTVNHSLRKARRRLAQLIRSEILTYSASREEFEDDAALFARFLESES